MSKNMSKETVLNKLHLFSMACIVVGVSMTGVALALIFLEIIRTNFTVGLVGIVGEILLLAGFFYKWLGAWLAKEFEN